MCEQSLNDYITEQCALIDAALDRLLPAENESPETIHKAMRYSIFAGGKRMRPVLCLAAAEACGGLAVDALVPACAVEMMHTYSLIHDDLPAMDNDDYRRGRPTNHKVFGAGMATMAGDGLLTFAFELLAGGQQIAPALRCELISILAKAAGPEGMVGGQAHDIESEGRMLTLPELQLMDHCKTGCLLTAPVDMALAMTESSEEEKNLLHAFAVHVGLLFQMTDDLLDVNGHLDEMGKMPHQDAADHKSTYVSLLGKERTKALAEEEARHAKEILGRVDRDTSLLTELVDMLLVRTK